MPLRLLVVAAAVAGGVAAVVGCASIVSGRQTNVTFNTSPAQAAVTVRDHEGAVVAQTTTPGVVSLKRGRTWLRPARYEATIEKPGFETAHVPLHGTFNPWALGNIVLGGPIGLGVDGATGALWKLNEDEVQRRLARADQPAPSQDPGTLEHPRSPRGEVRVTSAEAPAKR
jgi:hypothetical protein